MINVAAMITTPMNTRLTAGTRLLAVFHMNNARMERIKNPIAGYFAQAVGRELRRSQRIAKVIAKPRRSTAE